MTASGPATTTNLPSQPPWSGLSSSVDRVVDGLEEIWDREDEVLPEAQLLWGAHREVLPGDLRLGQGSKQTIS